MVGIRILEVYLKRNRKNRIEIERDSLHSGIGRHKWFNNRSREGAVPMYLLSIDNYTIKLYTLVQYIVQKCTKNCMNMYKYGT